MKVPVLLVGGGAAWETRAIEVLEQSPRVVLVRRCMDLADLLAGAGTGAASVAVVGAGVVGLDADVVTRLRRDGLRVVVVLDPGGSPRESSERLTRLGVDRQLEAADLADLPALIEGVVPEPVLPSPADGATAPGAPGSSGSPGELIVVWGPTGAPGRTTVAVGLAAELAHRGRSTLLLDADPYGGSVAQHLGVLDQVSGLLAAARLANAGELDPLRLAGAARSLDGRLRVLTGLPRPDRWVEVREAAFEVLLEQASSLDPTVVVDTGFCLEDDPGLYASSTGRNAMTLASLQRADRVVVVGSADPVGLTRLVRGLHDLRDRLPEVTPWVLVNRMRPSLGWSERDLTATVAGVAPASRLMFLPDDRPAADRALMAGRSLTECGESPLRRAIALLAEELAAAPVSS